MALSNFIPDVWSPVLLAALRKNTVAAALCNRDYEGEVRRFGDSVKITDYTDPSVASYTSYSDITWNAVADGTRTLSIDQANYVTQEIDDIDEAQARDSGELMRKVLEAMAYKLRDTQDVYIFGQMESSVSTSNPDHYIDEQTISTASSAYELLVDMSVDLDEVNVPEEQRWVAVTPSFYGLLLKDDRFVAAGDAPGAATRANGRIGEAAGFQVYKSNNLPDGAGSGAGKAIIAGYRGATTVADQIQSLEAVRRENRFGDGLKALHVYGVKVTRPSGLVVADVIVS